MALNGHQFLECYHAAFLGAGVINPLNLRLAPKELEYILADSGTKVCFTDQFFAPVIDKVRAATRIEHVVMIGDGDVPHDVDYEDLSRLEPRDSRRARGGRRRDPRCTRAARPACRRVCCSTIAPRCSTCTT